MKFCILIVCLAALSCFGQNALPQPIPNLELGGVDLNDFNGIVQHPSPIEISPNESDDVLINDDQQVIVKSDVSIEVFENTELAPNTVGYSELRIEPSAINAAWFYPESTVGTVGKYDKLEIGLDLPATIDSQITEFLADIDEGLNPFDPDDINLEATFSKVGGGPPDVVRYGFFYEQWERNEGANVYDSDVTNFDWRIRFAPWFTGEWSVCFFQTQENVTTDELERGIARERTRQEAGLT